MGRKRLGVALKEERERNWEKFQVEILRRQGISCNGTNSGENAESSEVEDRSPPPAATPMDLIRNPNIRKKFFILAFDWVANAVVYNGLSYNATNLGVSDYLAFFIGKNPRGLQTETFASDPVASLLVSSRLEHRVNMFSHACRGAYAKARGARQPSSMVAFLVEPRCCRRTRRDTLVRDHVVRDGPPGQEMGAVPDDATRWTRLRLLHVRSRRYDLFFFLSLHGKTA